MYVRSKHPRTKRIAKVLKYFRRNRDYVRYAEATAQHLPIGSGVIEASYKTLATQRALEALRDALAPRRRTGHLDATRAAPE